MLKSQNMTGRTYVSMNKPCLRRLRATKREHGKINKAVFYKKKRFELQTKESAGMISSLSLLHKCRSSIL